MPILLELLLSAGLLLSTWLPFHNLEQLQQMAAGGLLLWLGFAALTRSRKLASISTLFHFSLLLSFFSRSTAADGWLTPWFLFMFLASWCVVLFLINTGNETQLSASLFVAVILISPIHVFTLSIDKP